MTFYTPRPKKTVKIVGITLSDFHQL